jgi:hypothetical protein
MRNSTVGVIPSEGHGAIRKRTKIGRDVPGCGFDMVMRCLLNLRRIGLFERIPETESRVQMTVALETLNTVESVSNGYDVFWASMQIFQVPANTPSPQYVPNPFTKNSVPLP